MVLQLVKKFPAFLEPEGSSPYSQVPATCPYPEPTTSSPHNPLKEAGYLSPILVIFEDAFVILSDIIGDHQLNDSLHITQFSSKWLLVILFTKQVRCHIILNKKTLITSYDDTISAYTTLQNLLPITVNPLNAELNPICHLLALLGGATIVVVSRLRVKLCTTRK